jgi:hypothetical protein
LGKRKIFFPYRIRVPGTLQPSCYPDLETPPPDLIKKEAKQILRHKDLTTEIQPICNVKTKVIPVTTGATGTTSESFKNYPSNIHGKHDIKELQKTAVLKIALVLGEVHVHGK